MLPNIGHFKHGRVLVGGLHHFLRLALLGAAFVVSSTLQKITMLVGWREVSLKSALLALHPLRLGRVTRK